MCDSLVALANTTADGITIFAKNSDRRALECQPFVQFPAACHPPAARVRCTHIEIPEVRETHRVMGHSPWWVWGFEHGLNEHRVAIGNQTVFSREELEEEPGLIGMDLVRLGLERGHTARAALDMIVTLLARHGQGGAASEPGGGGYHNSFLIADPSEAWILETTNRRWAARPAQLDSCSNHYVLADDWTLASRDVASYARSQHWWVGDERIDFAASYRNPHVPGWVSEVRYERARTLLANDRDRFDVLRAQTILRDHGDGPVSIPAPGSENEIFRTLCAHSEPTNWTTASLVAPLPSDPSALNPVWISFAAPCSGTFLPVYLEGTIPALYATGGPLPEDDSAWWYFKKLQDAAAFDAQRHIPALRERWRKWEAAVEGERRDVEQEAQRATDVDLRAALLGDFMDRIADQALAYSKSLLKEIA